MRKCDLLCIGAILMGSAGLAAADGGVTFTDIADNGGAGITYSRTPTPARQASYASLVSVPFYTLANFANTTTANFGQKGRGAPGVALLDFDNDGDLDIYVTNGPGSANSLYSNQLVPTGQVTFVDVGASSGAGATAQDSTGVCFGDLDNDGDHDLYVVATNEPNILLENQGDGTFDDITDDAGDVAGDGRNAIACSMADVDNDGLLDIVVGNTYDNWTHRLAHAAGPTFGGMEENYLFHNLGGNVFVDDSNLRGIEDVSNMTGPGLSGGSYTWALATVDYDLDGDVDILFADNQGVGPTNLPNLSEERGYLRLFRNDGTGFFDEVTQMYGLDIVGGWMGIDFGDLNCDGLMDFFASDIGFLSQNPSRWFLGQPDGTFLDSEAGDLGMTPFGWGVSIFDYDNDGDGDIIYHGGMRSTNIFIADNPGVILQNEGTCSGDFAWDSGAILKDHRTRMVEGVAVGDLDGDGFEDIVSVSDVDINPTLFFSMVNPPFPIRPPSGGPFDSVAAYESVFAPTGTGWFNLNVFRPSGSILNDESNGTLAVELNSGDNGNNWAQVTLLGSAGILDDSDSDSDSDSGSDSDSDDVQVVNRDGIGGVVFFTPDGGKTSIRPIIGGSSYASQDALAANFGLGAAGDGTVEVLWPGGARNCLHDVAASEQVLFPHIPCGYDDDWQNFGKYNSCVMQALNGYKNEGFITPQERNRLRDSARQAFEDGACEGDSD